MRRRIWHIDSIDTPIPQSLHLEQYVVPVGGHLALAVKQLTA